MSSDLFEKLNGSVGYFWPQSGATVDTNAEPEPGYVKLDGNHAEILTLRPTVPFLDVGDIKPASAVVGMTAAEAALFLECSGPWPTNRHGDRASSNRYEARTVIGGVPIDRLRSTRVLSLRAFFPGIGRWAGLDSTKESYEQDGHGRTTSWTVTAKAADEQRLSLSGTKDLVLMTYWRTDGPRDRRQIYAPVVIGCESKRPVDVWDLLSPILRIQDLICFAHQGFVGADGGSADSDCTPPEDSRPTERQSLWSGPLMVPRAGVSTPRSATEVPMFYLADLGGDVQALRRWALLARRYARAVDPVMATYRVGPSSPESLLLSVAAGIEYWVRANEPRKWATNRKRVDALAAFVGGSFEKWVGVAAKWTEDFWQTYCKLKHEPTYLPDPWHVTDLALSGRCLLAASLLHRVAGSREVCRRIFDSHYLYQLGERLRSRYV